MLEIISNWTSSGSSGGLAAVSVQYGVTESVLYCQLSTIATTQSVSFQTAMESSGPWVNEATASLSTTGNSTAAAIRVQGPYNWMRPYLHTASTGTYIFRLVGVGPA